MELFETILFGMAIGVLLVVIRGIMGRRFFRSPKNVIAMTGIATVVAIFFFPLFGFTSFFEGSLLNKPISIEEQMEHSQEQRAFLEVINKTPEPKEESSPSIEPVHRPNHYSLYNVTLYDTGEIIP